MEERVNELLPLSAKIAREFFNIPGLPHAEIEIVAQEALARAALALDPAKGDFTISLYQLLTRKFPYRFDPKCDPIDIILNENPVPIRDRMPGLEKTLAAVIDKALVRNPKDRFSDAGKLLASLSIS